MTEETESANPAVNLTTYPESSVATDTDKAAVAAALDHSRLLDIHRWSDFPEADAFVSNVHARCGGRQAAIARKHFKVVLLDLYVAWLIDPTLKIALSMSPSAYKAKGNRYNALHISRLVIDVVNLLRDAGLIERATGFHDRTGGGQGRLTRIWPNDALIALFRNCQLNECQIVRAKDEEVIIPRMPARRNR